MRWKRVELTGWGRAQRTTAWACRPEREADVLAALADLDGLPITIHGAGRSYGDVALNDGGRVLLTDRLDRVISFNERTLEVECEPGVTFNDLLSVFGGRGYLAPVSPGTAYVTVGGAVATDIHGKNHESAGSFGDHVQWVLLALPSGEVRRVSRTEYPDIFTATIGGLGLTGVMLRIAFRLVPVPSTDVIVQERRIPNLGAFFDAFEDCRHSSTYSVAWIDGISDGSKLGRGIIETAEYAPRTTTRGRVRRAVRIPFDAPPQALNRTMVGAFNALYYRRVPPKGRTRNASIGRYLYPLDSVLQWNRAYGQRGFHQFQCVVPDTSAQDALEQMFKMVHAQKVRPFLGVLKTFGSDGQGYLSFPMRGYTLALDFPHSEATVRLLHTLHEITIEYGGRVYLAKDSALTSDRFRVMYPGHRTFLDILRQVDPNARMSSALARRLELRSNA